MFVCLHEQVKERYYMSVIMFGDLQPVGDKTPPTVAKKPPKSKPGERVDQQDTTDGDKENGERTSDKDEADNGGDKPAEKDDNKPAGKDDDKAADKGDDKDGNKTIDKDDDKPSDKDGDKPADKDDDDKPSDKDDDKPSDKDDDKPSDRDDDKLADKDDDELADKNGVEEADKTADNETETKSVGKDKEPSDTTVGDKDGDKEDRESSLGPPVAVVVDEENSNL